MNKKCINPKTYKLTKDQSYEVLKSEDNYIYIVNDNGSVAKYDNSLFEDENINEAIIPEPEPVIVRTEQDLIDSIEIFTFNQIKFRNFDNDQVIINNNLHAASNNDFSCGILRLEGINDVINIINNVIEELDSNEDLIDLRKALFKKSIEARLQGINHGAWMCSTNHNYNNEDYFNVLDEISTIQTEWFRNPNSGNDIKIWTTICNQ